MTDRRPVTLADVARAAGVAKSTASYAFSDPGRLAADTTARVRAAAESLGYAGPSALGRALASGRTKVVAVVTRALMEAPDADPFALGVIDGLSRELAALGYGVLLLPPITDQGTRQLHGSAIYDAVVTTRRIDGIAETDQILRQRGVPWVRFDGDSNDDLAVTVDAVPALVEILRSLVAQGHERIAALTLRWGADDVGTTVTGAESVGDLMSHLDRDVAQQVTRGRLAAFNVAGVTPSHVVSCSVVSREEAKRQAAQLLDLPQGERPTAIVCQADVFAWGVHEAATERGLSVPGDLSLVGFDGLEGGAFDALDLTTVAQDGRLKGRIVARWLVAAAASGTGPEPEPMQVSVRWGSSTGAAPGRG